MATYHCSIKPGAKGNGYKHAQYICREGKYGEKKDMEYLEHGNTPPWTYEKPNEFWKAADEFERANGVSYREIEIALPNELTPEQRRELVQDFIKEHIGEYHPYTVAIHCPKAALKQDVEQPHAHIMFSERELDGIERNRQHFFKRANSKKPELGGAKKNREWSGKDRAKHTEHIRESWAKLQNKTLEKYGHESRVDHRTLEAQRLDALEKGDLKKADELDRIPEQHLGPKVANKTTRNIKKHIEPAKTPEERISKRDEYYEHIEPSERAKKVFYLREYKRTKFAIEKETERLQKGMSVNYRTKNDVDRINEEIIKLTIQRKELFKKVITPERAKAIAYSVYSKGKYTELRDEAKVLEKETKLLKEAEVKFGMRPKPNVLDLPARQDYEKEQTRIAEWRKGHVGKINVHSAKVDQLKVQFESAEGQKKVQDIMDGVLMKNAPQREQLREVHSQLQTLRAERGQLIRADIQNQINTGKGITKALNNISKEINKAQQQQSKPGDLNIHIRDDEEERKKRGQDIDR